MAARNGGSRDDSVSVRKPHNALSDRDDAPDELVSERDRRAGEQWAVIPL
jgi:hypothetical protein